MAHELTITAQGTAEMAYTGDTPWHGLGQPLRQGASIEEWRAAAGMDWNVLRSGVRFDTVEVTAEGVQTVTREAAGKQVLYRSDTFAPLSVVSDRYQVVQPGEALEFFRDMVDAGGYTIETAGTLRGGARLWALARTGQGLSLPGGDDVGGYLLLATACDGSMATTVRETTVRVVCANTLGLAMEDGRRCVSVRHSTRFDAEKVKARLRLVSASFDAFARSAEAMSKSIMSAKMAEQYLARILPTPTGSLPVEQTKGFLKIMDLFNGEGLGASLASSDGTAWGLLNAVTEYVDHHQGRSADRRLDSAWFGSGDDLKARALAVLSA